jgi:hypothetical protein
MVATTGGGRRLGIGARGQIRGDRRCSQTQGCETDRTQQKLSHRFSPFVPLGVTEPFLESNCRSDQKTRKQHNAIQA